MFNCDDHRISCMHACMHVDTQNPSMHVSSAHIQLFIAVTHAYDLSCLDNVSWMDLQ
jgi:hypothetical protein